MHTRSLSEEINRLDKKDFKVKKTSKTKKLTNKYAISTKEIEKKLANETTNNVEKKTYSNLPQVRKVAIAKRRAKFVMLVALFVSCFSLSVFIGFIGPFLLFK